jgi:hypothetical protein
MQYADDTLLFLQYDLSQVMNLKSTLSCFEQAPSLNVDDGGSDFSQAISYHFGSFPMKYTGVPLHHNKVSKEDNLLKKSC